MYYVQYKFLQYTYQTEFIDKSTLFTSQIIFVCKISSFLLTFVGIENVISSTWVSSNSYRAAACDIRRGNRSNIDQSKV